ncbi:hypothetical protein BT96DRAFT_1008327, partial [Gymnopus androsaceus JB14]
MSLFERLVLKGFPHETLSEQHRMRPEILSLIPELAYPSLVDAPKTQNRPPLRGYRTDEMTVLTPYLGQLQKLRRALAADNDPVLNDLVKAGLMPPATANTVKRKIRLATIDNYQGEESDIITASLTRSNSNRDIGFMSAPEQLNVLLSRARDGLIMIGNAETYSTARKGSDLWTRFFGLLKLDNHIYEGLPVKPVKYLANGRDDSTLTNVQWSTPSANVVEGLDMNKLNKVLDYATIRKRRAVYSRLYHEATIAHQLVTIRSKAERQRRESGIEGSIGAQHSSQGLSSSISKHTLSVWRLFSFILNALLETMEEQLNQVRQNLDVFKQKAEKTHASLADEWIPVSDDAPGIISESKLIVKKCVELVQELLNTVTD